MTPQNRRVSSMRTSPPWSMAASPHLSRRISDALGADAEGELIGIVDRTANDISELRGDVAELRHQMEVGFSRVDARFETVGQLLEKELRRQTQFFLLAWAVILAAIIGLYTR